MTIHLARTIDISCDECGVVAEFPHPWSTAQIAIKTAGWRPDKTRVPTRHKCAECGGGLPKRSARELLLEGLE